MNRLFIVSVAAVAMIVLALAALVYVPQHLGQNGPAATPINNNGSRAQHSPGVELIGDNGSVTRLDVEIADTPEKWERGLMNRSSLAIDAGMLFAFGNDERRYFWMENTTIPLDMIFISSGLTVIDIHENAKPMSREIIASSGPCRYVLEVNGGLCLADGIGIGDRVRIDTGDG